MTRGRLVSINRSDGGVPKLPIDECPVGKSGLRGDRQRDLRHHGGPDRAVCLYSLELIQALKAEGHPISAGSIGENLTLAGFDWAGMIPGSRVQVGEVLLELTDFAHPCTNIAPSFLRGEFARVSQQVNPGWGRLYARVLDEGTVHIDDDVTGP